MLSEIILAGSISFDYIMRYPGKFAQLLLESGWNINFSVTEMQQHDGGVSANIAYTLALLGGKPRLFGTVGQDFAPYRRRLESVGVDCSTVITIPQVSTGYFFANTDAANNQIGSFYAGAMAHAGDYGILEVAKRRPAWVVISPNAPDGMARHISECQSENLPYIFDPSQQVAVLSADVLSLGIQKAAALTCNEYEWDVIRKHTGFTIDDLRAWGVVFIHTLGENGANIYLAEQTLHIPAFPPKQMVNPTGAGDAFRGGLLRGLSLGFPWEVAGRLGALCGTYALEHFGTQEHHFSPAEFVQRYRSQWDDGGILDKLI